MYLDTLSNLKISLAVLELDDEYLHITYIPTKNQKVLMNKKKLKKYAIMGKQRDIYKQRYLCKEKKKILQIIFY